MTLPPMPTGHTIGCGIFNGQKLFTDDQLRAYAEQAVAAERERCAAICDARSADHWRAYSDKSSPHFCDARFEAFSDEAEECATLIRGDNAKVSGAGTASAGLPG